MNALIAAGGKNDDASSIKVRGGDNCCAVAYQHNFSGWSAEFRPGDHNFGAFTGAGAVNDDMSSLRVLSDGCPSDHEPPCEAFLYQHGDYAGWSAHFPEGDYNHAAMTAKGAKNDDASSIKVRGGANCCVTLYEHGDFGGWKATYPVGDYPFKEFKARGAKNDKVSALKVNSNGCQ